MASSIPRRATGLPTALLKNICTKFGVAWFIRYFTDRNLDLAVAARKKEGSCSMVALATLYFGQHRRSTREHWLVS